MLLCTLSSFSRRRTPVLSSSGRALLPAELIASVMAPFPFAPFPLPFPLACRQKRNQNPFLTLLASQPATGLSIFGLAWLRRAKGITLMKILDREDFHHRNGDNKVLGRSLAGMPS